MKQLLLAGLMLPLAAIAAESQSTRCTSGDDIRTIEIVYPQATEVPCEVLYHKNGETKTLWSASNQAGYCESKAEEFIAKQQSWGWQCDADTKAVEAEPASSEEASEEVSEVAGEEVSEVASEVAAEQIETVSE